MCWKRFFLFVGELERRQTFFEFSVEFSKSKFLEFHCPKDSDEAPLRQDTLNERSQPSTTWKTSVQIPDKGLQWARSSDVFNCREEFFKTGG